MDELNIDHRKNANKHINEKKIRIHQFGNCFVVTRKGISDSQSYLMMIDKTAQNISQIEKNYNVIESCLKQADKKQVLKPIRRRRSLKPKHNSIKNIKFIFRDITKKAYSTD